MLFIKRRKLELSLVLPVIAIFSVMSCGEAGECKGEALACESMGGECPYQSGCHQTQECVGIPEGCYMMFSSVTCNQQEGCMWNSMTNSCSGTATECDSVWYCGDQEGCSTYSGCEGDATECDEFDDEDSCREQEGCSWKD